MNDCSKLPRDFPVVDHDGKATAQFQLFWQQAIDRMQSHNPVIASLLNPDVGWRP